MKYKIWPTFDCNVYVIGYTKEKMECIIPGIYGDASFLSWEKECLDWPEWADISAEEVKKIKLEQL